MLRFASHHTVAPNDAGFARLARSCCRSGRSRWASTATTSSRSPRARTTTTRVAARRRASGAAPAPQALGLTGRVRATQFNALVAGWIRATPTVRLRSSARDPKVAALDLTFSAPKSVSVLSRSAPDEVCAAAGRRARGGGPRGARLSGGDGGVRAPRPRRRDGRGGGRADRGGLPPPDEPRARSAAAHPRRRGEPDARPGRPLHGVARARRCIGRRRPPATSTRRTCAPLVSERLGLEWGPVRNGAAELAEVPAEVLRRVLAAPPRDASARRRARAGSAWVRRRRGEAAALATRERKQYGIDTHTWREEIQARAGEHGLGRDEIARAARDAAASDSRDGLLEQRRLRRAGVGRPARRADGSDRAREHVR